MEKIKRYIILLNAFILIIGSIDRSAIAQNSESVIDQDGNNYKTIAIGNQIWMVENLRATKYNDGTAIPLVTDNRAWRILVTPAYCWYNNDTAYKILYGALYNGYAVNTNKLCPKGWHISTDSEWTELIRFLGGENIAGGTLKESGTTNWREPNSGATNESGFTALPGGTRYTNGLFVTMSNIGYWWTFTGSKVYDGWYRSVSFTSPAVSRNFTDLTNGFSIRCIKD